MKKSVAQAYASSPIKIRERRKKKLIILPVIEESWNIGTKSSRHIIPTPKSSNRKTSLYEQTSRTYKPGVDAEVDTAVNQAEQYYRQKKALGEDFSDGPCLTNDLMANWVVDIVHLPRETIDNEPQNQCQAYLEGRAKHFVELDTNGNLVRVH